MLCLREGLGLLLFTFFNILLSIVPSKVDLNYKHLAFRLQKANNYNIAIKLEMILILFVLIPDIGSSCICGPFVTLLCETLLLF